MTAVQAGGGGYVHDGVYDGDVAGWHPRCGEKRAARWFGCELAVTCPRCVAGIRPDPDPPVTWDAALILDVVEQVADDLASALNPIAAIDAAVRRLRGLRELAKD